MGNSILKGMSAALLVTVITLLAGMLWTAMGLGGLTMSTLVDIGLIVSCVAAGYRAGKESGQWILGGVSALGYVILCIVLLSLFLDVSSWGGIQVLAEGGLIGILAGAFGAGSGAGKNHPAGSWRSSGRFSTWGSDPYNRETYRRDSYAEWDSHVDDWEDSESRDTSRDGRNNEKVSKYGEAEKNPEEWMEQRNLDRASRARYAWEEDVQWTEELTPSKQVQRRALNSLEIGSEEGEWEDWVHEEKRKPLQSYRKAWWEEDVL